MNLKAALLAVLVMIAGVTTSCDKSMNEPMAPVISNDDISSSAQGELRSLSDFATGAYDSDDYKLDKARRLKEFMKNSRGSYLRGAVMQYIYEDYGLIYDNPNRVGVRHWTTSKSRRNHAVITEELLKHLRDFKTPILMIGTTAGGSGHYFTIVSIVWGGTMESSDIWFCDSTQGSTGDSFSESANPCL